MFHVFVSYYKANFLAVTNKLPKIGSKPNIKTYLLISSRFSTDLIDDGSLTSYSFGADLGQYLTTKLSAHSRLVTMFVQDTRTTSILSCSIRGGPEKPGFRPAAQQ